MQAETSPDFLTRAVGYVVGFIVTGGLLGFLQYKLSAKRSPVEMGLAQAQTEQIRAQIRREDGTAEFAAMRALAQEARADVQRLREDRDYWQARAEKAERRPLEEEMHRLPGPPHE